MREPTLAPDFLGPSPVPMEPGLWMSIQLLAQSLLLLSFLSLLGSILILCDLESPDWKEHYHLNSAKYCAGKFTYFFHLTLIKALK